MNEIKNFLVLISILLFSIFLILIINLFENERVSTEVNKEVNTKRFYFYKTDGSYGTICYDIYKSTTGIMEAIHKQIKSKQDIQLISYLGDY